ncbi:MAG TPA: hypothetical protein VM735_03735, partial [Candidatus Kapabacteria bacterium]|nr:hypothetical protein [Candidatus Kapabacteria bacterium]
EGWTELQIDGSDVKFAFWFETLNTELDRRGKGWIGAEADFQIGSRNVVIANNEFADDRNGILLESEVDCRIVRY